MHDPKVVAFTIPQPWGRHISWGRPYWHPLVTIWHRAPERHGSDDSCDWFGYKRPLRPDEIAIIEAIEKAGTVFGNPPHFTSGWDEEQAEVEGREPRRLRDPVVSREYLAYEPLAHAIRSWRTRPRRWRIHPRWHLWHWRLQVHPVQHFRRWAWSRCATCRRRFTWAYSPISDSWDGSGPLWFRSESGVHHHKCHEGKGAQS